eukprot:CAMPEP_0174260128 /NCGR_PEP_ID=MMETSP0439-20130205/8864_1 /TAXON_ID=0 /ORGANISM="Stereomyxa ramosa, Strain Chinc5" /LENGTH=296 /DNA_ID=CAMNT_0015344301 /DNA_START=162 /DNA_END=1049 /DNA_ORIENTATION=+
METGELIEEEKSGDISHDKTNGQKTKSGPKKKETTKPDVMEKTKTKPIKQKVLKEPTKETKSVPRETTKNSENEEEESWFFFSGNSGAEQLQEDDLEEDWFFFSCTDNSSDSQEPVIRNYADVKLKKNNIAEVAKNARKPRDQKQKEKITEDQKKAKPEVMKKEEHSYPPTCGYCNENINNTYLLYSYPWNPLCTQCYCSGISLEEKHLIPPIGNTEIPLKSEVISDGQGSEDEGFVHLGQGALVEKEMRENELDNSSEDEVENFCHWCNGKCDPDRDACLDCQRWAEGVVQNFGY